MARGFDGWTRRDSTNCAWIADLWHTPQWIDNIPSIDPLMKDVITGGVLMVALIINVVFAGRAERDRS